MQSRPSPHQTWHIASVILFVWLFAVVASWANACILEPSGSAGSSREHHERSGVEAQRGSGHEGAAGTSAAHQADPAQQACASFCDTEQSIVTKAQPAKGDGGAEQSALMAQVFACWAAFTPGRAEVRWRPLAAPPPPGPPAAIALLRLTI